MSSGVKIAIGVIFCIVLPGILQCVGFFKNEWAAGQNATCPIVKLRENSCGERDYNNVFALELIGTLVYILPIAAIVSSICGCEKCADGDNDDAGSFCVLLACALWMSTIVCVLIFPFVGILILTGCIIFSTHFPTSDLEASFSLCILAGCFHILGMIYLIGNQVYKAYREDNRVVQERTVNVPPPQYQGNVQTVSGRTDYMQETTTVVHDPNTGTTIFSRDFKFISIFE